MAMKKHMEENSKANVDELFAATDSPKRTRQRTEQDSNDSLQKDKTNGYDVESRPESGIASQSGYEFESDDDDDDNREDGKIFFRFDEHHELQQLALMQQQQDDNAMQEESV
eukprot:gene7054-7846_t